VQPNWECSGGADPLLFSALTDSLVQCHSTQTVAGRSTSAAKNSIQTKWGRFPCAAVPCSGRSGAPDRESSPLIARLISLPGPRHHLYEPSWANTYIQHYLIPYCTFQSPIYLPPNMSSLFSKLLSGDDFSGAQQGHDTSSRVLTLRPSSMDPNLISVVPAGLPATAPPLYSVGSSPYSKPNIIIYRGAPNPGAAIGHANLHTFSSKADLSIHGQTMTVKASSLSGNFSFTPQSMAGFKWKADSLSGNPKELIDSSGQRIAKISSSNFLKGEKSLEIFVAVDDYFLELIVATALVAKTLAKNSQKMASEVASAVAGA